MNLDGYWIEYFKILFFMKIFDFCLACSSQLCRWL